MTLPEILHPIRSDMEAVDSLIRQRLGSDIVLINQLGTHIINSGGKRLRPALALLAARSTGSDHPGIAQLAAVIEFIHTATLLHDDVVDHSELRRGDPTANALWGNEASVLTGDFLYSRAFQLMVELDSLAVLKVLADTTNRIAEGEVLQLMNCHNPDISEDVYNDVIERKTAILFEAAARTGGLLGGAPDEQVDALARFGSHLGRAFQLIDDCLDYRGDPEVTGKNLGDDLAEGKTTLPVIIAMQRSDGDRRRVLASAIETGNVELIDEVIKAIDATDAIAYTARRARAEADSALSCLELVPESEFRDAMAAAAQFAISRSY